MGPPLPGGQLNNEGQAMFNGMHGKATPPNLAPMLPGQMGLSQQRMGVTPGPGGMMQAGPPMPGMQRMQPPPPPSSHTMVNFMLCALFLF